MLPKMRELGAMLAMSAEKNNQGCGTGHYIELHVRSSHQHEKDQLLYS